MQARASVLLLIGALLTGCAGVPRGPVVSEEVANRATDYALSMVGVPYRYGGSTPEQGFDCSGLVQWSYGRAGLRLPRSPETLAGVSTPVPYAKLRRGDLLIFTQLGKKSSHVGIYVGGNRFVHSPRTGKTVEVVTINEFWQRHLDGTRRLVAD